METVMACKVVKTTMVVSVPVVVVVLASIMLFASVMDGTAAAARSTPLPNIFVFFRWRSSWMTTKATLRMCGAAGSMFLRIETSETSVMI